MVDDVDSGLTFSLPCCSCFRSWLYGCRRLCTAETEPIELAGRRAWRRVAISPNALSVGRSSKQIKSPARGGAS